LENSNSCCLFGTTESSTGFGTSVAGTGTAPGTATAGSAATGRSLMPKVLCSKDAYNGWNHGWNPGY